jgi:hypothetical protein
MPAPFDHIGEHCRAVSSIMRDMPSMSGGLASGCRVATVAVWATAIQFLGAMETVNVLPRRLPQPVQQSFRSRSSTLVCGGRPCCSSAAAT